ncbi:phospholipase C [Xanthomonas oryzae pv. oryzicola]|uniref:phosphocholine-specific phospholipase C n=2 Tax=Xanthomonas oryzae TaxID=347 RepID=UPI0006560CF4|nr:phospholipase C, phosphocholine-specific [Xanthomonas oryzae]AKN92491.1 phospholipase C [Xanthomonas oryzae pv. oryzicola]AKN96227.1 phospholipase C [Xanthomonas oryzae pv. oryzicola]AKO11449.1 phospholipase C [Xanthomonas oryzae pv. oryzicola]AKO15188.1 phospholipase C [Xanthomonas oryzae pv. oryzicola]
MTSSPSRRDFLKRVAALTAAGALPASIGRALALPANARTGTLRDLEHVVILMQENRSFDHYFGALRGVRGFGDPRALQLRDGHPVWSQPAADGRRLLPFAFDSQTTCAPLIKSLDHSWKAGHGQDPARWAAYDAWVPYKGELTMGYFQRHDIPYYHALADAFTICDGYYCSLHGPTNPNRMYLFTGTSGPSVGNFGAQAVTNADDSNWTADMARDKPGYAALEWTTYAQRLQAAGVDWRVYQEYDNFGCNSLAYFSHYRDLRTDDERYRRARACVPGSSADNAATTQAEHLVAAIAADVQANRLPQVSWVIPPTAYCEHPEAPPAYGESLVARLIDALTANPEVWAKTALIINYDENDGFFDHVPAPLPAVDARMGRSNVDTRGEVYDGVPIGLGIRVPMLVISPWTRGGWVNSQVFDHTSVLRLLERRFGVAEPNISPWRRAVSGDLTSVFDFRKPDDSALSALPSVDDYRARTAAVRDKPLPSVPAAAAMPRQEPGQRPARALPYALQVHARVQEDAPVQLQFVNSGAAAAAFNVYSSAASGGPWYYTVLPGTQLEDAPVGATHEGAYALRVHGPNGFLREFAGQLPSASTPSAAPWVEARQEGEALVLEIGNAGQRACTVQLRALDYADPGTRTLPLAAGQRETIRLALAASDHWYDLVVEQPGSAFRRRLAGHLETGRPSRSDPAFGRPD